MVVGGIIVGGAATGIISGAALGQSGNFVNLWVNARTLVKTKTPDGKILKLKNPDLQAARILSAGPDDDDWTIEIKRSGKTRRWEGSDAACGEFPCLARCCRTRWRRSSIWGIPPSSSREPPW